MRVGTSWLMFALVGSLGLSGCAGAGCEASNAPSGQVALCNQKNSFSYATNAGFSSRSDSYTWSNSATKAQVHWAMNLGQGSASITVKDALGVTVFSKTLSNVGQASSSQATSSGQAGDWTIEIRLSSATGQVAFEVHAA